MPDQLRHSDNLRWFQEWGNRQECVRAVILTSSLTCPSAKVDIFSDYDVIFVVTDVRKFFDDKSYLDDFGEVLTVYKNPMGMEDGFERFGDITQYCDGTKIDYAFFPVEWLQSMVDRGTLNEDLDLGYQVLLDKDGLASCLPAPTHRAYIPKPPDEKQYLAVIEEFYAETPYVAKNIWREDLFFMKYNLYYVMVYEMLRKMLDWRMEIDQDWNIKTGAHGKGLKRQLRPDLWEALEKVYVGAGAEENWQALFDTIDLFRKVAMGVGENLGYPFPEDLHSKVLDYLDKVKTLPPDAVTFQGLLYS